jgi:Protein of unknown function (DUF3072)
MTAPWNRFGTSPLVGQNFIKGNIMSDQQNQQPAAEKDPEDWVTGDESMTGPQASYLKTLSQEAGEEFDPELSKAEASKRIDALQQETGRGVDH